MHFWPRPYSDDLEEVPPKHASAASENEIFSSFIEGKFNPSKSQTPRSKPARNRKIHTAVKITWKRGIMRALRGSLTREDKVDF